MEIKKLTIDLLDDYLYFFDHLAFSKDSEWAGCYCVWYHWQDKLDNEWLKLDEFNRSQFNRNYAIELIKDQRLKGYLLFKEGKPVAWCNTNNRKGYDRLSIKKRPELWQDDLSCKAIVCFTIAPHMRRQGLSKLLLERVCLDAKKEGYTYVEAYPTKDTSSKSYHGPISAYLALGFEVVNELEKEVLVRKYL